MKTKNLWFGFISVIVISFAVLGYYGYEIYLKAPPIPEKVVTVSGKVLFTAQDIKDGQNVWQSMGGQEVGTIWGHGAYLAPDWSADWLHREAMYILNRWSKENYSTEYEKISDENKAMLQVRLQKELRTNTYDVNTKEMKVSVLETPSMAWILVFNRFIKCSLSRQIIFISIDQFPVV